MKKFLLKIVLFFALCALAFGSATSIYIFRARNFHFAFPPEKHVLFIGHSHIEVGIDPAIVPESINWAKSGNSYVSCSKRLSLALRDNPQIDTVFIAVAPHNFRKNVDGGLGTRKDASWNAFDYFPYCSLREFFKIYGMNGVRAVLKNPIQLARSVLLESREAAQKRLGGYLYHPRKSLEKDLHGGFEKRYSVLDHGGEGILYGYFRKMVDECRARNIRVIALNMPLYHANEFYDTAYFYKKFRELFPDVELWDYADFPISDDCRADINHLNCWGAEIFSKEIAERMAHEGIIRDAR